MFLCLPRALTFLFRYDYLNEPMAALWQNGWIDAMARGRKTAQKTGTPLHQDPTVSHLLQVE